MAKSTKRKSTGNLPDGKKKTRKITNTDDDYETEMPGGMPDKELFVADLPVGKNVKKDIKSRKSEPAKLKVDEYHEDVGRMESQQFLALVKYESKKKKAAAKENNAYIENFAEVMEQESRGLQEQMENLTNISDKHQTDFLAAFKSAYGASRPRNAFASLYERSNTMTSNALRIVEEFNQANGKIIAKGSRKFISDDWASANESLEKLLELGHQAGLEKVEALLMGQESAQAEMESEAALEQIYPKHSEGSELAVGWGKIAHKQSKAAKRMVKASLLGIAS